MSVARVWVLGIKRDDHVGTRPAFGNVVYFQVGRVALGTLLGARWGRLWSHFLVCPKAVRDNFSLFLFLFWSHKGVPHTNYLRNPLVWSVKIKNIKKMGASAEHLWSIFIDDAQVAFGCCFSGVSNGCAVRIVVSPQLRHRRLGVFMQAPATGGGRCHNVGPGPSWWCIEFDEIIIGVSKNCVFFFWCRTGHTRMPLCDQTGPSIFHFVTKKECIFLSACAVFVYFV